MGVRWLSQALFALDSNINSQLVFLYEGGDECEI